LAKRGIGENGQGMTRCAPKPTVAVAPGRAHASQASRAISAGARCSVIRECPDALRGTAGVRTRVLGVGAWRALRPATRCKVAFGCLRFRLCGDLSDAAPRRNDGW
jgi:hypothetical protein